MKKILFTINYFTNGGPSNVIKNIIKGLDSNKYKIYLMTFTSGDREDCIESLRSMGVKIIQLNISRNIFSCVFGTIKAKNAIKAIAPDIIHASGVYNGIIVGHTKVASNKVYTVHSNIYEDFINTYGTVKGNIMIKLQESFYPKYSHIVGCSKSVYKTIKHKTKNASYVNNGIAPDIKCNTSVSSVRDKLKIPKDAIVYIYCGHLNKHKRILELAKMMNDSMGDDEYFIILGNGEYYDSIKDICNNHIKVLGFVDDAINYMKASDIYVSNSDTEGFSMSIIEALSQGLYLLLSDIESHKDVFNMAGKIYLGEIYDKDFILKKEKLLRAYRKDNKQSIRKFQQKYLSDISMATAYEKLYSRTEH